MRTCPAAEQIRHSGDLGWQGMVPIPRTQTPQLSACYRRPGELARGAKHLIHKFSWFKKNTKRPTQARRTPFLARRSSWAAGVSNSQRRPDGYPRAPLEVGTARSPPCVFGSGNGDAAQVKLAASRRVKRSSTGDAVLGHVSSSKQKPRFAGCPPLDRRARTTPRIRGAAAKTSRKHRDGRRGALSWAYWPV